jgi:hypothetical protein
MKREAVGVVAISPEAGAETVHCGQREMRAPNHFKKSAHRLVGIHMAILIHEPLVVY